MNSDPRKHAESKMLQLFVDVFQDRLEKIDRSSSDTFRLEPHERDILLDINNSGIFKGTMTGIGTLVMLRYGRAAIANRLARRAAERHYTQGNVHNIMGSSRPFQPKTSTFMNIFGWILDTAVSFSIAATSSLYFTDVDKVRHQLESLPLSSGQSRVAQEFCPPIIATVNQLSAEDSQLLQETNNPYLASIRTFQTNCLYRTAYEMQLRREKGVSDTYIVQIPEGGVPTDPSLLDVDESWTPDESWTQDSTFMEDSNEDDNDRSNDGRKFRDE